MEKFKLLTPDQIEVKVKQVTEKGVTLLLYKTARTDMDMLDDAVGAENWECDYREIKGNLYCGIGVNIDGKTTWKWDCGIESREDGDGNEKKGEASDAFKRAGFRWGIGRELYSAPFVFVKAAELKSHSGTGGRWKTYDKFSVDKIGYDANRRINELEIKDEDTGKVVFKIYQKSNNSNTTQQYNQKQDMTDVLYCQNCGEVIRPVNASGKKYSPTAISAKSMEIYKKQMCWDCMKAAKKASEG